MSDVEHWPHKCPSCGGDNLEVAAQVWVKLMPCMETSADDVDDGSHEWDDTSPMRCIDCSYTGDAGEFVPAKPDIVVLQKHIPGIGKTATIYPAAEVRHDLHGWYVCTREEADHEDKGNMSTGFDGREHYATEDEAQDALTRWYAENDDDVMIDMAPACWASYLVNGDASGLDDLDQLRCDEHCETAWKGWRVVSTIGEPYFSWSYGNYGGTAKGGELVEYVLHRNPKGG